MAVSFTGTTWILVGAWLELSSQNSSLLRTFITIPVWIKADIICSNMVLFQGSSEYNTVNFFSWATSGSSMSGLAPETFLAEVIWVDIHLLGIEACTLGFAAWLVHGAWPWHTSEFGDSSCCWWVEVVVVLVLSS